MCWRRWAKIRRTRSAVFVAINFCYVLYYKKIAEIFSFAAVAISFFFAPPISVRLLSPLPVT